MSADHLLALMLSALADRDTLTAREAFEDLAQLLDRDETAPAALSNLARIARETEEE